MQRLIRMTWLAVLLSAGLSSGADRAPAKADIAESKTATRPVGGNKFPGPDSQCFFEFSSQGSKAIAIRYYGPVVVHNEPAQDPGARGQRPPADLGAQPLGETSTDQESFRPPGVGIPGTHSHTKPPCPCLLPPPPQEKMKREDILGTLGRDARLIFEYQKKKVVYEGPQEFIVPASPDRIVIECKSYAAPRRKPSRRSPETRSR